MREQRLFDREVIVRGRRNLEQRAGVDDKMVITKKPETKEESERAQQDHCRPQ